MYMLQNTSLAFYPQNTTHLKYKGTKLNNTIELY